MGENPIFPHLQNAEAKQEIDRVFHQKPSDYGIQRTRWRLQDLGQALEWLKEVSLPGICRMLKRLKFSYRQALVHIRSPDSEYAQKQAAIASAMAEAAEQPDQVIVLYMDELTYYRRPSHAPANVRRASGQPRAVEQPGSNTQTRIVGVLNPLTGKVTYLQRSIVGRAALITFYQEIRKAYPKATKIYVVQDNWPNHKLPEVIAAMTELQIIPLFLPTYASWLNPIEMLWKWLKQTVIHLHPYAGELEVLRKRVREFLDQFSAGSKELLHYVGLLSG